MATLLSSVTSDGAGASVALPASATTVTCRGTFGPKTQVYIEHTEDGGTTWQKTGLVFRTQGVKNLTISSGAGSIRGQVINADVNTSITLEVN